MKQHHLFHRILALMLALCIAGAVGAVTVFAAPGDGQPAEQQEAISQEQQQQPQNPGEQPQAQPQEQEQPQEQPVPEQQQQEQPQTQPEQQQQPDAVEIQAPVQEEWYDYIYNFEDATSAYEEPEHLGELPAVTPSQVVEATAVPMPAVAVSDASLFSGIVMWLCVALGIAVIVGVLVSKRTRRRGA